MAETDFKTLLEARDRSLSRLIDYDLKMLTLLIALATAWSVIDAVSSASEVTRERAEKILALSGLLMSLAWMGRRRFLWQIDDRCALALMQFGKISEPAPSVKGGWTNLKAALRDCEKSWGSKAGDIAMTPFRLVSAWSMRNGEIFAVFAFSCFVYMAFD